jgi:trehalose 6-phosphate synthase/phosphatase
MASINIDNSQLNNIINFKNDKDIELKGRVISVVNHIPYRCILNANSSNESVIEKIKTMGRQKLQPMPSDDNIFRVPPNSNFDPSPISHIDRRRSTVTSLAQTNMWTLSLRKGHSAMYAALDHLKHDYKTLYIGGTGSIATEDGEDVDISDVTDVNRDSLRDLLKSKYNIVPLFIPDELSAGHYEGYSKKGKKKKKKKKRKF